jgi:hypothetical protein
MYSYFLVNPYMCIHIQILLRASAVCVCDAGRHKTLHNTIVLCIVIFITGMVIIVVTFMIVVLYGKH